MNPLLVQIFALSSPLLSRRPAKWSFDSLRSFYFCYLHSNTRWYCYLLSWLFLAAEQVKPGEAVVVVETSVKATTTNTTTTPLHLYIFHYVQSSFVHQSGSIVLSPHRYAVFHYHHRRPLSLDSTALNFAVKSCWSPIDLRENNRRKLKYTLGRKRKSWNDLVQTGYLRYLDSSQNTWFQQISAMGSIRASCSKVEARVEVRKLWKQVNRWEKKAEQQCLISSSTMNQPSIYLFILHLSIFPSLSKEPSSFILKVHLKLNIKTSFSLFLFLSFSLPLRQFAKFFSQTPRYSELNPKTQYCACEVNLSIQLAAVNWSSLLQTHLMDR